MSTERELIMYQKATVLDLLEILKQDPEKTYTVDELEKMMFAYLKGLEQKLAKGRGNPPFLFFLPEILYAHDG